MEHGLMAVTCVKELETPFLALDLQKFSANIERLQNRLDLLGALTICLNGGGASGTLIFRQQHRK